MIRNFKFTFLHGQNDCQKFDVSGGIEAAISRIDYDGIIVALNRPTFYAS